MRTTLARQLRRADKKYGIPYDTEDADTRDLHIIRKWRLAHPRKPKAKPTKEHRRSRNRRSK